MSFRQRRACSEALPGVAPKVYRISYHSLGTFDCIAGSLYLFVFRYLFLGGFPAVGGFYVKYVNVKEFFLYHQIQNSGSLCHIDPRCVFFYFRNLCIESIQNPLFLLKKRILLVKFTPLVNFLSQSTYEFLNKF